MAPSIACIIIGFSVLLHGLNNQVSAKQQPLCAGKGGIFIGLAIDEESYVSISGQAGEPRPAHWQPPGTPSDPNDTIPTPAQKWTLTEEVRDGPKNSFGGKYLQVSPESHRTYPSGLGKHLKVISELEAESPYLSFLLRVKKGGEGWHSLFARWTGGDDYGGGDSFFVVLKHKGKVVPGERTIKPAVVPIDTKITTYAGCCYNMNTHACPCFREKPDEETCPEKNFLDTERASGYGRECVVGQGAMDLIKAPQWYLFSGQEDGNVMDFADEPWDATCEANGSNTHDSGHDFPSWYLEEGDYDLRIYAREDGTALDGIYVAGPDSVAPGIKSEYDAGDSTLCSRESGGVLKTIGIVMVAGLGLAFLLAFVTMTEAGGELTHRGKMAINGVFYRNSSQQESGRGYEQMGQLEVGTFQVS